MMRSSVVVIEQANKAAIASISSSADPVTTLRDAWRRARQSLSFTAVRGRQDTSTHHLHIAGHSTERAAYRRGEGVESRPFRAGSHRWKLTYCPNGAGNRYYDSAAPETAGGPSVELRLMGTRLGDVVEATAGLTVSVLDGRDGTLLCSRGVKPQHCSSWDSAAIRIDVRKTDAAAAEAEAKAALRFLNLKDDSLVVRCDLTVHSSEKESRLRWLLRKLLD